MFERQQNISALVFLDYETVKRFIGGGGWGGGATRVVASASASDCGACGMFAFRGATARKHGAKRQNANDRHADFNAWRFGICRRNCQAFA